MKAYPKYQSSIISWLGELPEKWEIKKIKFVSSFKNGYAYSSSDWKDKGLPVLRMSNFSEDGKLRITENNVKFISEEIANKTLEFRINKNDLLIAMTDMSPKMGILGKTIIFDIDDLYFLNQRVGRLLVNGKIDLHFLHFYTNTDICRNQIKATVYPNVQYNASTEAIVNAFLPLPSLPEQKAIASFLDEKTKQIDTLIEKKQRMIELLKEERQAVINESVTKGIDPKAKMKDSGIEWLGEIPEHWEVKKLKYLVNSVQTGNTPPSEKREYFDDGNVDWFTPSDFGDAFVLIDSNRKITQQALTDEIVRVFPPYSILLVGIGATLGKLGIIENSASSNQQINAITFSENMNPYFGLFYLKAIAPIIVSLSNASTLAILNQSQTKDILMLHPPKEEQDRIVVHIKNEIARFELTLKYIESGIELLQEYRTALITEVVTGKVCVV